MTVSVVLGKNSDGTGVTPICMFLNACDARKYIEIIKERSKSSKWMEIAGISDLYCDYMDTDIIFGNLQDALNYDNQRHGPTYASDSKF